MRAYYINLASRTDRREAIERQLSALGLISERVEAVLFENMPARLQARFTAKMKIGQREFSTTASHLAAYGRFLATGDRYALIVEDDVVLSTALPGFLAALEAHSETIDLLRLETFGNPQQLSTQPLESMDGYGLHSLHGWAWGAAAYVVSRDAARRLSTSEQTLGGAIDRVLYRPNRMHIEPLVRRQLIPALAIQQDRMPGAIWGGDSDLKAARTAMIAAHKPGWRLRIADFAENEVRIGLASTIHRLLGRSTKRDVPFRPE
ncbi:glycosyltransferase family 25 protein [Devosia sp. SL43]|uniref:glycosyltransferase family 25 protein n=1 Tax=Devosia sp. SL43 TaxID=2806348 RepID=UPI001F2D0BCE|nr:glycosyltransferase family 25 protein [Devosia sp. SL43]UJW83933.1 glycosyltransferase family 25 protein [Devosia sp. SL43]